MAAANDLRSKTREELEELAADLAKQRTEVRLQQNAVADELAIREAVAGMPASAREGLMQRITTGGKVGLEGDSGSGDKAEEDDE